MNKTEIGLLEEPLYYLHVKELQEICKQLHLPFQDKKLLLINCIIQFILTGKVIDSLVIPKKSRAQKGVKYPFALDTYMLYGAYKNDAKARAFFKSIIGPHFHFTVYGLDWLQERWMQGNPPTYQEFITFWKNEYEARKVKGKMIKKEWAYMRFVQQYMLEYPHAGQEEINKAWQKKRVDQLKKAKIFLRKINVVLA
jgi:hypothetical protein